jgi:hypothetical protein
VNEPSGIFGLSVFWAWAIPLALIAANAVVILVIRRDNRAHDAKVKAIFEAERLMGAAPLEVARAELAISTSRAMEASARAWDHATGVGSPRGGCRREAGPAHR